MGQRIHSWSKFGNDDIIFWANLYKVLWVKFVIKTFVESKEQDGDSAFTRLKLHKL